MPEITSRHIGIALDMFGCPNRCRHCYLGAAPNGTMTERELRWVAERFRGLVSPDGGDARFEDIDIVTWSREPDYSDDYRRLYELEVELSDVKTYRAEWELMSVWRVARDPGYAPWAHSIGLRTCQMTFFGVGETQDWFYRRRGAFEDCITTTQRLLDTGIKPRWQVFFTRKGMGELDELMRIADLMRLRERCAELGGEFVMFIHTPGPEGEAESIEDLRPTIDDVSMIPSELIHATERHFGTKLTWKTVGERVGEILSSDAEEYTYARDLTEPLWFIVNPDLDVFANTGAMDPWWRLGNSRCDSIERIVANFEEDATIALRTSCSVPLRELAKRYGDPASRLIDGDVERLWHAKYCRELWMASISG